MILRNTENVSTFYFEQPYHGPYDINSIILVKLCGMVVDHPLYFDGLTISTLPDIIEAADSRPMSQLSKASSRKSRILPIQGDKLDLPMNLIEIEDEDEEIIDSYYEGSFTISCVSKLPERKEEEPPSKQSAPKAKKDQKPPPRQQMSYAVGSLIEDFDIAQAGIEITNSDSDVDFGATKEGFHFSRLKVMSACR